MKRNIGTLTDKEYDVIIIGAGMFGACAVWEAAHRGLKAALLEKGDFCQATSANHYKMVHGGIRYIQHGDIYRIRESSKERAAFLRVAPHLVKPLPILMPTFGHGIKGKEFLGTGMKLYDFLTADRNSNISDPDRKIPGSSFLNRKEVLELFPGVDSKNLTGGAVFSDAQMYNPPRLALSFIRSAELCGADVINYAEIIGFIKKDNKISGVKVKDVLNSDTFEISGKMILNTTGPWSNLLLEKYLGVQLNPRPSFSRDAAFVIKRKPANDIALAMTLMTKDVDSLIDRGGRHVFIVPWMDRDYLMAGVWHVVWDKEENKIFVTEEELQEFLNEVNSAYPTLNLKTDEVSMINTGLTLFGETTPGSKRMSFGKRSLLIDHSQVHSIEGLISLIGVRATVARGMAEKVIELISKKINKAVSPSQSTRVPVFGGKIGSFKEFLNKAIKEGNSILNEKIMLSLVHNYGSEFGEVVKFIKEKPELSKAIGRSSVIKAEVVHAIREEMAQKLGDVVLRRTDLGTAEYPGKEALKECAELMASELNWTEGKVEEELQEMKKFYENHASVKSYN